jgi:hypothetical protein
MTNHQAPEAKRTDGGRVAAHGITPGFRSEERRISAAAAMPVERRPSPKRLAKSVSPPQHDFTSARELLAPVYGWFTEGFDTRDLQEAKALLGRAGIVRVRVVARSETALT